MEKRGIFCCCRTLFVIWVVSLNEIAIQRSRYCFFFFFRFFLFLFRCQLPPPFFFLTVDYSLYPLNFCNYCGFQTVSVDSFHAQYCNHCGAVEEIDAEKLKAQQEQDLKAAKTAAALDYAIAAAAIDKQLQKKNEDNSPWPIDSRRGEREQEEGGT
jgi:hypothetical protein